jgi:hypothetical protein
MTEAHPASGSRVADLGYGFWKTEFGAAGQTR